jgi:hypothetical protein
VPITYKDWLKTEDRDVEDEMENFNIKVQERLLEVTKTAAQPMIQEAGEDESQPRPGSPARAATPDYFSGGRFHALLSPKIV